MAERRGTRARAPLRPAQTSRPPLAPCAVPTSPPRPRTLPTRARDAPQHIDERGGRDGGVEMFVHAPASGFAHLAARTLVVDERNDRVAERPVIASGHEKT